MPSRRDVDHVFERLRSGLVPERGLEEFAVGIERPRGEIRRLLDLAGRGEGVFKFLRGGYGCGKTFLARLAVLDAQAAGFATSFVVVSDNDLHFHRFDELYRRVVQELGTSACPRGALADVVDRWIARVEEALVAGLEDADGAGFDEAVARRLAEEVTSRTAGKAPEDLARVLRTIFALKQAGELSDAGALLSWLSGSENVAAGVKRAAGIKGDIGSREAMDYLRGVLEIVKAAGYKGLVIVIDEAETILRMRQDVRGKSLNGIRQIIDAAAQFPGLFWLFTGTPELFDTRRGVAGLAPLHERIQFLRHGESASLRQPQLALTPFDETRLREVALRLRELYPASDPHRVEAKVTRTVIDALVAKVTEGFRGDVGVVPRQFLRRLVDLMDLVEEDPTFEPGREGAPRTEDLNEPERRVAKGEPPFDPEPEDEEGYSPALVEV
ncbi:MAG TPA: BREX system ATP-binding protein BrxD [Thermoanaerobaculia bacterium]|nr:BREX system ATP-binding protein BrxD [Thermoanaerobaculia bacterium]HQN07104.1 BREX system ATP-binding protein BrxD [Thermoanaerobaculia bacterium]HQP84821.1 BREX system ATP-binding protein BrxD [Thermoanaerobaculia bacterium]